MATNKIAFVASKVQYVKVIETQLKDKNISNITVFSDKDSFKKSDFILVKYEVEPNIDEVAIVDLCSVWEKCGVPDDMFNWNKVKGEKSASDGDEPSIEDVMIECRQCNSVVQMIKCKRETIQSASEIETTYYCPECGGIANIRIEPLADEVEVVRVMTSADIDYDKSYSVKEIHEFLSEMIKYNTRAKTSWCYFVHKQCKQNDIEAYKVAIYGYAQGVYSITQAWKRIMKTYDA